MINISPGTGCECGKKRLADSLDIVDHVEWRPKSEILRAFKYKIILPFVFAFKSFKSNNRNSIESQNILTVPVVRLTNLPIRKTMGKIMRLWRAKPPITVPEYLSRLRPTSLKSSDITIGAEGSFTIKSFIKNQF